MQRFNCLIYTIWLLFLQYNLAFQFQGKTELIIFEVLYQEFVITDKNDTSIFGSHSLYFHLVFIRLSSLQSESVSFRHFFSFIQLSKNSHYSLIPFKPSLASLKSALFLRVSVCPKITVCSVDFAGYIRKYMQNRYAQVTCCISLI